MFDLFEYNKQTKILFWISLAGFMGMLIEFSYSAVLPRIIKQWNISGFKAGLLFSAYRAGYIVAILFVGSLTDVISPRKVMIVFSIIGGVATGAFGLFARGIYLGGILRILAGIGAAGIYVPGMKIISTWFPPKARGKALGTYVGITVIGLGFSVTLAGQLVTILGWRLAILSSSLGPITGAIIVTQFITERKTNRDSTRNSGVSATLKKAFSIDFSLLKNRKFVRAVIGYAGHNWELYGMWSWIAPFTTLQIFQNSASPEKLGTGLATAIIATGGIGSIVGGKLSDHFNNNRLPFRILLVSGLISLLFGWVGNLPLTFIVILGLIYGFLIVADSPAFTKEITKSVSDHNTGSALALQSFLGFIPTAISPLVFGGVIDLSQEVWGWAFATLTVGPIIALLAVYGRILKQ